MNNSLHAMRHIWCQAVRRRPSIKLFVLVAAASMGLAWSACGGQGQAAGSSASTADGIAAPDFLITTYQGEDVLGGQEVEFSQVLAQGKPVVLNMWAGLCPPCRAEMPDLQAVYEQYNDRVLLFGLDVGPFVGLGTREDGKALLEELNVTYPAGTTFDAGVVGEYRLLGMPSTYFITPDGTIVRQWAGILTEEKLVELIEELLAS
jgi:thiol-disulfide isomerase/thioredoxin